MANAAAAPAWDEWRALPSSRSARSCFFRYAFAEDSLRPEDQEGDQHQEGKAVLIGHRHVSRAERLDDAERKAADDGAGDVAEAADDGGGEGLQRDRRAHLDRDDQHGRDET